MRDAGGRSWVWLGAILVVAAALRLWGLNGPLWYDEILTVDEHLRLPWSEFLRGYSMNFHYLHNIQAKLAVAVLGEENWVIRLPSMMFGLGAIAAIWVLARDLGRPGIAHVTALLLAVSYHHIWFSQNARGYTELAFWSTLSMILFLRGLRQPGPGLWLGYGVTLAGAVYTHLTGAFLFVTQGLVWVLILLGYLVRGRSARALWLWPFLGYALGAGLTMLLYAPVLPSLFQAVGGVSDTSAVDVMTEYQNPFWTLAEAVRTAFGTLGPVVSAAVLLVIVLIGVGATSAHRRAPAFAPVVGLHIVLTIGLLLAVGMRIWPRFFFVDIGFLMVLIVLGVDAICRSLGRWRALSRLAPALFPLATVGMVVISLGLAVRNYMAPKQDLAGALAWTEAARTPGEPVYVFAPASDVFIGHFGTNWRAVDSPEAYQAARMAPGPALFVTAFPQRVLRVYPALEQDIAAGRLTLVKALPGTLGDGRVLIFRSAGQ